MSRSRRKTFFTRAIEDRAVWKHQLYDKRRQLVIFDQHHLQAILQRGLHGLGQLDRKRTLSHRRLAFELHAFGRLVVCCAGQCSGGQLAKCYGKPEHP